MNQKEKSILAKVLIIGDSGKNFDLESREHKATLGADFFTKQTDLKGEIIHLQLWDTAGQERFPSLGTAFYRGSDVCVIVFDITNPDSFKNVDFWKESFLLYVSSGNQEILPIILIGNKVDLEQERKISTEEAQAWCNVNGGVSYFEVSAKDNIMIEEFFQVLTERAYEKREKDLISFQSDIIEDIPPSRLSNSNQNRNSSSKCAC